MELYDNIFWFGDLNYRVDGTRGMVQKLLDKNMMDVLLSSDQLISEMQKGNVFQGFVESPITFPPTYKFNVTSSQAPLNVAQPPLPIFATPQPPPVDRIPDNSLLYDSSLKQRIPSWTDRILYREGDGVVAEKYGACMELCISDHKPVFVDARIPFEWTELRNTRPSSSLRNHFRICRLM